VPIDVVSLAELSSDDLAAWRSLRAADARLASPCFHPSFAAAVDAVGLPVSVAVARRDGIPVYLLPFHRERRMLRPVGWPGADFQGPIADRSAPSIDPLDVVRAAGARALAFDHVVDGAVGFDRWVEERHESPFVDVTGGLDGYLERASNGGRSDMKRTRQRLNQVTKQVGPVRYEADSTDHGLLDALIALKRRQYVATGARDHFATPAHVELMHRLLDRRGHEFAGVLSGLYAGDRLVAAHFGIRSDGVLNWWFPVYDPEYGRLAPGWLLLRKVVEHSPDLALERIDLGRGDSQYKRHLKTGESFVCAGRVGSGAAVSARRTLHRLRRAAEGSRPGAAAKDLAKRARTRVRAIRSDVDGG